LVAGEPEWSCEAIRQREGIPVPRTLWERMTAIAAELRVTPPQPTH